MTTEPLYYLETQLRQLCKTSNDAPRLIVEMLNGIPELKDFIRALRCDEIEELEREVSAAGDELTNAEREVERLEKRVEDLEQQVEDLNAAVIEAVETR